MVAASATCTYGICVQVARMNAPAPMMGGMSCPPVLAAASMAAAKWGLNPARRIRGMVKVPVVTTLATALPERDPMNALATEAVLAGPPRVFPATRSASPNRRAPPPATSSTAPKRMKRYTKSADTPSGTPQMPSVVR
jgi:hypothetical protein